LKKQHRVSDAEFLVDGIGYFTALAWTDLSGDLNYSNRNIVENLLQTFTMRIGRFHETWNGSQPALVLADCLFSLPIIATGITMLSATNHQWKHSNRRAQSSSAQEIKNI